MGCTYEWKGNIYWSDVKVEKNTVCGIGSVIMRNVKENQLVLGYPAKRRNF